ncbi:transposase domain-containing protein [Streptomyces mirabilis]|uniref:transposase domain-containing protein n=1 Tax=Streptomyces mirabilis TaxID=68239 RepID=UPI00340C0E9A
MNSRVGQRITSARAAAGIRLEALDEFVSPQAVEEAVRSCGRLDRRWCASLPASAVVYFVLAMCLHFSDSYAEILRKLTDGLRGAVHAGALRVAGTSAVSKARTRLGPEPLKALFEQVCGPLTTPQSPGAFAFGRRLLMLSLDGTVLDVAPTQANTKAFGPPPGGSRKPGRHPQVKLVLLIACGTRGTRGILGARFGPRRDNEVTLAKHLATSPTLSGGQLVLMERAFHGHDILARITDCGADFIVRAHAHLWLPHLRELADGSFLSCVPDRASSQRQAASRFCNRRMPPGHPHGVAVRVVDADITATPEHGPPRTRPLRVITSLLDPGEAPAEQFARSMQNAGTARPACSRPRSSNATTGPCCAPRTPTASPRKSTDCSSPTSTCRPNGPVPPRPAGLPRPARHWTPTASPSPRFSARSAATCTTDPPQDSLH